MYSIKRIVKLTLIALKMKVRVRLIHDGAGEAADGAVEVTAGGRGDAVH